MNLINEIGQWTGIAFMALGAFVAWRVETDLQLCVALLIVLVGLVMNWKWEWRAHIGQHKVRNR